MRVLRQTVKKRRRFVWIGLLLACVVSASGLYRGVFAKAMEKGRSGENGMTDAALDYTESTEELVNPERGFYKALSARLSDRASGAFWTTAALREYTETFGLLHLRFGLENYSSNAPLSMRDDETVATYGTDGPIGDNALRSLRATLENVRAAGGTAIVRFSYNVNGYRESIASGMRYVQAEPAGGMETIETHIAQLGTVLQSFGDVVAAVETGMFGPWGEQHSTALATASNVENYYRLGEAWLAAAPNGRSISFRRPLYFMHWASRRYDLTLDEATLGDKAEELAAIGGDILRVGCYNDGYLGSSSDLGTFDADNRASVTKWLSTQAQTTFYGGEAVADSASGLLGQYNSVSYLAEEGFLTHTSYLNIDWNDKVVNAWRNTAYTGDDAVYKGQSGYTYIANRLGYRLVLRASSLSTATPQGGVLRVVGRIENVGFGNVVNDKKATVVFVNAADESVRYAAEIDFDVTKIGAKESVEYDINLRVPSRAPAGDYKVYLRFADRLEPNDSTMRGIRFANVGNEYVFGANFIGRAVVTQNAQAGDDNDFEQIGGEERSVTVTFVGGEEAQGELAPIFEKKGARVFLPRNPFTRPHYAFTGWSDGARVYQPNEPYTVNDDVTFTAVWRIESYRVKFDGNGGTLVRGEEEQILEYGSTAVAPEYDRAGYVFVGWDKAFDAVDADMVVSALWRIESCRVKFDGSGGTLVRGEEEQTVRYGSAAVAPEYSKEGYVFVGWDTSFDAVTADLVVTAQWEKKAAPSPSVSGGCGGAVGASPVGMLGIAAIAGAVILSTLRRKNGKTSK